MPVKTNSFIIRKVEHEFGLTKIKPRFPKMLELYLELLINKKKVNGSLAAEKYIHHYEPIVSSEDSIGGGGFKAVPRITSIKEPNQPSTERKGTFMWESSDSMEPSPILKRKVVRPVSSSPLAASISSERYRKVKRSILSSSKARNEEKYHNNHANKESNIKEHQTIIPPVKEIKKVYGDERPNVKTFGNEYSRDEDDQKRELLFKFDRLKKTYPKVHIPNFNMMSNHLDMKKTYDHTLKNLAVDSTVETYKSYLMMGFMGCEIVLGKIGFDMEGYTQQQTLYMSKYEKLLIELGEKSYVPSAVSSWPVEIRLMALVLFQTTIFVVSKIIAKKTNVNLLQMYNSVNGVDESQSRTPKVYSSGFVSGGSSPLTFIPKTKRTASTTSEGRMRGPSATKD